MLKRGTDSTEKCPYARLLLLKQLSLCNTKYIRMACLSKLPIGVKILVQYIDSLYRFVSAYLTVRSLLLVSR
jgi:hypothetical protein